MKVNILSVLVLAGLSVQGVLAQMTIVNAASFIPGQPVAPGSFASMFGEHLCAQTASGDWVGPGRLPTALGGCSVTVNGTPAMLHYISPGQINFIVPPEIGRGPANVAVTGGPQSVNGTMMIEPGAPGTFTATGMGMGNGAILHGTMWRGGPFSTTTDGQPTVLALYVTGLDLATKPEVSIGGVPAEVLWFGPAPGLAGLQQINIKLPADAAGVGRVPVTVTSNGQTSNVTFMNILPTTGMMQGMPGWGGGMMGENMRRGREMSFLALNPANNTALVTDEDGDAVRVLSLDSRAILATISLPDDSLAHAIAVNQNGTLAAVALGAKASVALLDLAQNKVTAVVATGNYPARVAFTGDRLLVSNAASGSVSVIDTNSRTIVKTVITGFGASGIAVSGNQAVVANMQAGSLSLINLTDYSVTNVALPAGSRPHEVAISASLNKALITTPMANGVLVLNLATKEIAALDTGVWNGMGPGGVVANGNLAYVANQMTASVTVIDLAAGKVLKTFPVDPGPRALALNLAKNQLMVLAQGTGTLDVVDLTSYAIIARIDAGGSERQGRWTLPAVTSLTPNTAAAGSTFTLTIAGTNLQQVKKIEFHLTGMGSGGMMGGGGMMPGGGGSDDANIKVSNLNVNPDGTQITASVQILAAAAAGTRQVRLETDRGEIMGPMFGSFFTVTR